MSTFKYKVHNSDTLQLGDSSNTVSILGTLNAAQSVSTYEEVTTTGTADVADPDISYTLITSGGAHSVTLADGSFVGQVKNISITAVASGTITITPAHLSDATNIVMAEIYDNVTLVFDGTDWNIALATGITTS